MGVMSVFWRRKPRSDAMLDWCPLPGLACCDCLGHLHPQRRRQLPCWRNSFAPVARTLVGISSVQLQLRWHGLLVAAAGSCCCMGPKLRPCLCHPAAPYGMACPVGWPWLLIQTRCSSELKTVIPGSRNPSAIEAVAGWPSTQAAPRSRDCLIRAGSNATDSIANDSERQS